jgi:hypothetical protein
MRRRSFIFGALGAAAAALAAGSASAQVKAATPASLAPTTPRETPILKIKRAGRDERVLSVADLEAMPKRSFRTRTPWDDAASEYEGVPLKALFDAIGAKGDKVVVAALNGFMASIPLDEAERHDVILAYRRDGAYMPVRAKGPLFIVYNYDAQPAKMTEQQLARSVWQVESISLD